MNNAVFAVPVPFNEPVLSYAPGTNDKAGSALNLLMRTSLRIIKETFVPPESVSYPFMTDE